MYYSGSAQIEDIVSLCFGGYNPKDQHGTEVYYSGSAQLEDIGLLCFGGYNPKV